MGGLGSLRTHLPHEYISEEKILGEIAKCKAMEKVASQKEVYKKSALICKEAVWFFCSK